MDTADKCPICLSGFQHQAVASLEKCPHVFCLQCLLQWSQTANTCPVDRISFAFIYQRRCPGGDVQKKIKVKTQNEDVDDDEEASDAVICEECGRSDRRHQLLVCTHCDSGYHMNCLPPSLNTEPGGDWICPDCAATPPHTDDFKLEDGELTDLLAEVDETASTSSRLRPSTINRPSGSAERRHSARLRSRTGVDPDPRPQTSWHVPKYLLRASRRADRTDQVTPPDGSDGSSSSAESNSQTRQRV
ncbi:PHD and RING finger domain-containing protein 1-like [Paralichthys olivaceus]|uniref:PHD and RING finger domain-containing protein 1-like n=1 Tax=Paralichthys olivaceus TaxID=8255 RepID=UPI0037519AC7